MFALLEEERLNLFRFGSPLKKLAFLVLSGRFRYQDRKSLSVVDAVHITVRYPGSFSRGGMRRSARDCLGNGFPARFEPPPAISKPDARRALGYGPDELLFVAVRRLVPRNGILRLVDTALRLRSEEINARLVVVGRGPLAQELRDSIRENDLEESIELAGFVPDEQLALYYAAADADVDADGRSRVFGMPAIESLSYGTPCIATPCGSLQEVLAPFPGMLSELNQSDSFASAVLDFARSVRSGNTSFEPDELRKHVGSFYSDDAIAKDVESLLLSVTTRSTR